MRAFLAWYLPAAFEKGADVVEDRRMDGVIEDSLLADWRKQQQEEGGIGAVPFVGQDYDEAWATNFEVRPIKVTESQASLMVRYSAPAWSPNLRVTMVLTPKGWRISGYEPE